MIPLYIDVANRIARKSPYDPTPLSEIDLRAGDSPVFNLFFMQPTADSRGPFIITRFQSAAISMQLLDAGNAAVATQGTWTELVPATTAPTKTRIQIGDATHGEYDRVVFPSQPGSGSVVLCLTGGVISKTGASSGSVKVYPGVTLETEVAAALAAVTGAPYTFAWIPPVTMDLHGSAAPVIPRITEVNVDNLQYLFGYTAALVLTGAGVSAIASLDSDTPEVSLAVKLTPSGGAAATVLMIPVNLST